MHTLGICSGASTITIVSLELNGGGPIIEAVRSQAHEGNPKQTIQHLLAAVPFAEYDRVAVTGRGFKRFIKLSSISESHAIEYALDYANGYELPAGEYLKAVISAGGETFIVYQLGPHGKIEKVYTGNKCASGTGEFFLQQTRRMGVNLNDAVKFSRNETPHSVSGRCSVFCKSDCTHATNKGIPKGQVVAGLCNMMGEKILELLKNIPRKNIMIIGGATQITPLVDYLAQRIDNLIVPVEATYFESLGAALWASQNECRPVETELFQSHISQFDYHSALQEFESKVHFAQLERGAPVRDDVCILGLDVGSTTTKIVLLRESDKRILASEYLRTNGDPVGASVQCYQSVQDQLAGLPIQIRGLGVTGSGRKIAGLHALTDGIYNEIIAHAEAALFFDKSVDTIFEIGGQDAKYTYITNGVASDYAMNEACSAGTGSFLEESAQETLGLEMEEIARWALRGQKPPNFNDQCAAFISSDIKNAFHEGIEKEDVVAGLVYSICMNYLNRVKGSRPVGRKVFMQGGVCYNRAVPIAMAALSGKEIVVPPEPGLMGAFGVALEVINRIQQGLLAAGQFDLQQLINREVTYKKSFTCAGGREKCDLGCEINRVVIEDKTYPFGGSCNLYYNLRNHVKTNPGDYDLVQQRQHLVFKEFAPDCDDLDAAAPTVGLLPSFLLATYYPLFAHFFHGLGYRPNLANGVEKEGLDRVNAPFCYPCELSHGYMQNILDQNPDFVFIPHLAGVKVPGGQTPSVTCPLVQGEAYYNPIAFEDRLVNGPRLLRPVIDLNAEVAAIKQVFIALAKDLGHSIRAARISFQQAWAVQAALHRRMLELGREALSEIEADPNRMGVVLLGRPYNAFITDANKGIPHKFASRAITIIPVDFLDLTETPLRDHMYWSMGQINLKGAEFIKNHPQLFGTYITNFSCGPDSFIIGYFREIMGKKPSLTLELDNHTADAGLETRIEAFLDIVQRYRNLAGPKTESRPENGFLPARAILGNGKFHFIDSNGAVLQMSDPRIRILFPSMSQVSSQALSAVFRHMNIDAMVLPVMDERDLKIGRGNSTCKECLPLQLTLGAFIRYLKDERRPDEFTIYFMPTADGPCRFGQYQDFMGDWIKRNQIPNVALISLDGEDGYAGLGSSFALKALRAAMIADLFDDIYYAIQINAVDRVAATQQFHEIWDRVLVDLAAPKIDLDSLLANAVARLKAIPHQRPLSEIPTILMVGEIYVRKEGLSRRWLPERLLEHGILAHCAPIHEWTMYLDWLTHKKINRKDPRYRTWVKNEIKIQIVKRMERKLKQTLAESGWYQPRFIDIEHIMEISRHFISTWLTGEAALTTGGPLAEVGRDFCGAISIGPFGCMPNRLSESILYPCMDREHLAPFRHDPEFHRVTREVSSLPFLSIESDGNPFPQLIEARLEAFVVQALRMHKVLRQANSVPVN